MSVKITVLCCSDPVWSLQWSFDQFSQKYTISQKWVHCELSAKGKMFILYNLSAEPNFKQSEYIFKPIVFNLLI